MPFFLPLIVLIIVGLMLAIALARKGRIRSLQMGGRMLTLESQLDPNAVYDRVAGGVDVFAVEDRDPQTHVVLLSTKPTLATWGFFYPVVVAARPGGGTIIQVGIKSRLFQAGPLVTKWHNKCLKAIDQAVNGSAHGDNLPAARVVSR
ncbi:MAG TPA: hypothetical protein VFG83_14430 [Kofleriaceae bacterium]|nr:hypothetical protein [Kofleriaceae bacterium]